MYVVGVYPSGMSLPRQNHKNAEEFPAAGEPDPVNPIGTGLYPHIELPWYGDA